MSWADLEQAMSAKPIRDGFHTITPYLFVENAAGLVKFLTAAFGGEVIAKMERPDGSMAHVEMRIGDSMLMLGEPTPKFPAMPSSIYLSVTDCDAVYARAVAAGGTSVSPVMTMPSGERYGGIKDPAGNLWWVATHVEDVPPEEQARRWGEFFKKMGGK